MFWWTLLDIDYDSDLKTIKKSYAKLLKENNPEDNPEGYQKLRQAYDAAIKNEKRRRKETKVEISIEGLSNNEEIRVEEYQNEQDIELKPYRNIQLEEVLNEEIKIKHYNNFHLEEKLNDIDEEIKIKIKPFKNIRIEEKPRDINDEVNLNLYKNINIEETQKSLSDRISEFVDSLNEIYDDVSLRINLENWHELMNRPIVWNVDSFSQIEDEMFKFVCEHKYLEPEVWSLIEASYNWTKNELYLYRKYEVGKVEDILIIIKNPNKLKYKFIINISKEYLEEYISLIEKAVEEYNKKRYFYAKDLMDKAYKIYSKDPELLELYGLLMMKNSVLKLALDYFKQALEIDNTKFLCAANIGYILNLIKKYNSAIPYLEIFIKESHNSKNINDKLALYNLGYAFYYNKNYSMAKFYFFESLKIDEFDMSKDELTKKYLENIEAKLQGKIVKDIKPKKVRIKKSLKLYESKDKVGIKMWRFKVIMIIIIILFVVIRTVYMVNNISEHRNETNHIIHQYSKEESSKSRIKSVGTIDEFITNKSYETYSFNLKNIIETDLYANIYKDGSIGVLNEAYLNNNNAWEEVYSKIYVGSINGENIMFIDKNYSSNLLDKDGGYTVTGEKVEIQIEEPIYITMDNGDRITINKYFIYTH
jgi:Tfp pilus assembly protein PilF